MTDHMGDSARNPDEQRENTGDRRPDIFDAEGWRLPLPVAPLPQNPPDAELRNQRHLKSTLERHGWRVVEWPICYDRDGRVFRPDMLVYHVDMPAIGAVEVKSDIADQKTANAALKQAFTYTNTKLKWRETGRRIEWAAVFPWRPSLHGVFMGEWMWGGLNFTAHQLKVCAFVRETDYCEWDNLSTGGKRRPRTPERIRLQYGRNHRVWCTENGFVLNAVHMLTGKRQIGGSRRNV